MEAGLCEDRPHAFSKFGGGRRGGRKTPWAGTDRLAVILAKFANLPEPPDWKASVEERVFTDQNSLKDYLKRTSYNRLYLEGEVFGPYIIGNQVDYKEPGPLKLYWHATREDSLTTATPEGRQDARDAGYLLVRTEGYVFFGPQPGIGTAPLQLFWHPTRKDNLTTATPEGTQDARDAGYEFVRTEGYVFSSQQPGTVPLKLWWHDGRKDNLTTTSAGDQEALAAGYRFVRTEGYVSSNQQPIGGVDYGRAAGESILAARSQLLGYRKACVIFNDPAPRAYAFGTPISGTTITGWNYHPVNSPVGVLAMENIHSMAGFWDLYGTWASPGPWDDMDCSCGTHPSAFTKKTLGWLTSHEIASLQSSSTQALLALGLPPQSTTVSAIVIQTRPALGYDYYIVELRQRVDDYERGKANVSVGIPAEGVVVYFIDELRWPPVHRRALLQPGQFYRNFTHNNLGVEFHSLTENNADIRISMNTLANAFPTLPGITGFFASESIILARHNGFLNPSRNSLDPAVHFAWASSQSIEVVLDDLLEKYKFQYERHRKDGADEGARFYADSMVRLVKYGINLSNAPTYSSNDPANSADWSLHYNFAQAATAEAVTYTIETVFRMVFHFLMESPKHFLVALFAWESGFLARLGGYSNPARNDTNPAVHFSWALANPIETVRDDLIEKYSLQYDRLYSSPWAFLLVPSFYAEVSLRLNSLGVDFGSSSANSLDYYVHQNWAVNATAQRVRDETARRIQLVFGELSKP